MLVVTGPVDKAGQKETTAEKSDISLFLGVLVNLRLKSV